MKKIMVFVPIILTFILSIKFKVDIIQLYLLSFEQLKQIQNIAIKFSELIFLIIILDSLLVLLIRNISNPPPFNSLIKTLYIMLILLSTLMLLSSSNKILLYYNFIMILSICFNIHEQIFNHISTLKKSLQL